MKSQITKRDLVMSKLNDTTLMLIVKDTIRRYAMAKPAKIICYFVLHWPENIDGETVHVHVWETENGYFTEVMNMETFRNQLKESEFMNSFHYMRSGRTHEHIHTRRLA